MALSSSGLSCLGQKPRSKRIKWEEFRAPMLVLNRLQAKLPLCKETCKRRKTVKKSEVNTVFPGSTMGMVLQRHRSHLGCRKMMGPEWWWRWRLSLNNTTLPAGPCSGALWLEQQPLPSGDAQQMSGFNEISHYVEGLLWSMYHTKQVTSWRLHLPATLGKVHWTCDEADKP